MKGIDVSSYQGNIDFRKVKEAGYEFVIIRLGIGDNVIGQDDSQLQNNIRGCEENGLPYGFYLVSYAVRSTGRESVESEIEHTRRLIQGTKPFCIFYDMEVEGTTYLGKEILTNFAMQYCNYFKVLGYQTGVYANSNWFMNYLNYDLLRASGYKVWLAHYGVDKPRLDCDIWQYTNRGTVPGIVTNVTDLNIMYHDILGDREQANESLKSISEIVQEVIDGKWGNGEDRKKRLTDAGYDYNEIQVLVNELLKDNVKYRTYIVQKGDTLSGIASKYGLSYQRLASYNNIANPDKISIGQSIKIPKSS